MDSYLHTWRNLPVILTDPACEKSSEIRMSIWDLIQILEYSTNCLKNRRKEDKLERCSTWRGHNIKIVLKKAYSGWTDSISWIVITIIEER